MKKLSLLFLPLLLSLSAGCGSDDAVDNSPVGKCRSLGATICAKAIECQATTSSQAQCVANFERAIMCGTSKAVLSGYDACVSKVKAAPCDVVRAQNLPDECDNAIQ